MCHNAIFNLAATPDDIHENINLAVEKRSSDEQSPPISKKNNVIHTFQCSLMWLDDYAKNYVSWFNLKSLFVVLKKLFIYIKITSSWIVCKLLKLI